MVWKVETNRMIIMKHHQLGTFANRDVKNTGVRHALLRTSTAKVFVVID